MLKTHMLDFSNNKPENLVIIFHGYGASGDDLVDLAHYFKDVIPNSIFMAPDAPNRYEFAGFGYQWFSLQERSESFMYQGVCAAREVAAKFIDEQLKKYHLTPDNLILMGFSQGGMLALHTSLNAQNPPKAVISFSGALIKPDSFEKIEKQNVLLIHGDMDEVVNPGALPQAINGLNKLGIYPKAYMIENMGHEINQDAIACALEFLSAI